MYIQVEEYSAHLHATGIPFRYILDNLSHRNVRLRHPNFLSRGSDWAIFGIWRPDHDGTTGPDFARQGLQKISYIPFIKIRLSFQMCLNILSAINASKLTLS